MMTISELCKSAGVSQQTFYRQAKNNKEFGKIIRKHRKRQGNAFLYGEPVLQWLQEHYPTAPTTEGAEEVTPTDAPEMPSDADQGASPVEGVQSPDPDPDDAHGGESAPTQGQGVSDYASLIAENMALKREIERVNALRDQERASLMAQNSQLLLLLQEEKQSNILLLQSAHISKPSLRERVREFFAPKRERGSVK
jgi:AcrR family transcriptional regulator